MSVGSRPAVPDRVRWAVDVLAPRPSDQILEIGGGPGISAALICARLRSGRLLAVDRSAVAIERTVQRNAPHLTTGRLVVRQCELGALDEPANSFDQVLALNVNVFWVREPARELAVVHRVLRPGGRLHVLYDVGAPSAAGRIIDTIAAAVSAHGFEEVVRRTDAAGTGISARKPP